MAVKSGTKDICGNPAPEQVEKLFWERERLGFWLQRGFSCFPVGRAYVLCSEDHEFNGCLLYTSDAADEERLV